MGSAAIDSQGIPTDALGWTRMTIKPGRRPLADRARSSASRTDRSMQFEVTEGLAR